MFSGKSTNENSETKVDGSSQSQEDSCNHSSCNSLEDLPPLTSDDEKYLNYIPSSDEGEASLSGKEEVDAKPAAIDTKSPSKPHEHPESMNSDRNTSLPKDMIKEETIKDTNETNMIENEEEQKISANESDSEEILKINDELEWDHLGINSLPQKHNSEIAPTSNTASSPDTIEDNETNENEVRRPVFTFGSASASGFGNAETTEINATATPTFATSFQVNSENSFSIGVATGNSAPRGRRSRRATKRRRSDHQQNEEIIVEDVDSEEDEDEDYDDLDAYDEDDDESCDCEYCMNERISRGEGYEISMALYNDGESDDDASDEMPPLIDRHNSAEANPDSAPQENVDDSDSDDSSYVPEDDASEDSESYADDHDSDDDSEGYENMPVLISRREAANYSDSSDSDSHSDSNSDSNNFGDMPALVVRRNSSSSSSSYESSDDDEDLSVDIEDENESDDDETNQCAICFTRPRYGNSFVVLPCCGVSDQTDGGGDDTSTTRFCHNCMVKTLQGNTPRPFGLGIGYSQDPCVGECPRCRSLLTVHRYAYGSQAEVIAKVTLTQIMEHALKRENADYFGIFATLSYANPTFLPSELGGPSDDIGQLCSWGIVTKKKGKKKGRDIYQMEKKDQLEMRNYLENHILTAAKDVSIRMVASANMMAAICYTFFDFKIWRCLRLINSLQPIVISFIFKKFPEIEEEWQEILMAVLTSYLFLLVAQVALVVGAYLALAYISIRCFAQFVEGVKTIRSRLNEADYSSVSRVYQTIVIPKEVMKWKCVFFLFSVHWFVRGAFTVNRILFRIATCLYGWRLESFLYFVRYFFEGKDNTSAAIENVTTAVEEVIEGEL